MEPLTIGVYILAVAISGHGVSWFFTTPKEMSAQYESRLRALETGFNAMSVSTAGMHGRHEEAIESLTIAMNRLTVRIDTLMDLRTSGEHRTL
jgi:hypothetical protein